MNAIKSLAIVVLAAGVLALLYGGFSYTKVSPGGHIGSLAWSVKDREHVNVPIWGGVGAIVIGAGLLLMPAPKT
jgi:hypothetical protein